MKILLVTAAAEHSIRDVADGYEAAFEDLGHELKVFRLANRLQFWNVALYAWAEATGQDVKEDGILLPQIVRETCDWTLLEAAYFRPDVVFVVCGMAFHPNALAMLRIHGYKTAIALTESPYNDAQQRVLAELTDWAFVNDLYSVGTLKDANPHTYYLPTAYNEHTHVYPQEPLGNADVVFVGTGFGERLRMLEAVDWTGIDLQLFGFFGGQGPVDDVLPTAPLPAKEPIDNLEAIRRYAGSKVCLNFYRAGAGFSVNPRAYELAAVGAFQLAQDSVPEAHSLFGDSIAYFDDAESLGRQVRYWLAPENEERRRNMAEEARARVQGQSYRARAETALTIIERETALVAVGKEN